ncbi:MAG: 6,7-dimethyl-8-ribityllumazine synthase [Paludibacteraceae bacterium]|nr:6,7-dimethyl-8-ribityllumazine synthase [Paludibacteraceae bacterium]
MASRLHNLSEYDPNSLPPASIVRKKKFAIAVADWNSDITFKLYEGAVEALKSNGATKIDVVHVPGAFELTYAAHCFQMRCKYDAIIIIGCVIRGDTPHFDYICSGVTQGISYLNAHSNIDELSPMAPVIFGLLTVNDKQQALDRAGGALGNKGVEAGITAIRMATMNVLKAE